jgi:hypothetical protein
MNLRAFLTPRWRLVVSSGVLVAFLSTIPGYAQTPDDAPLVAFVVDRALDTAPALDTRDIGLSRLTTIFQDLGARTTQIDLLRPVPEDVDIVVLVRPLSRLPDDYVARLWVHLQRGGGLLLAIDPSGHDGARTDFEDDGLPTLLALDYGVEITNAFLAEPWFSLESILIPAGSYSRAYPDLVLHPVTEPLLKYDLPVTLWGARALRVEPMAASSYAVPLVATETSFGEVERIFERRDPPNLLEFTLEEDLQGRLDVGAIAENLANGSRVAVFGDAALFLNGFRRMSGVHCRRSLPGCRWMAAGKTGTRLCQWPRTLRMTAALRRKTSRRRADSVIRISFTSWSKPWPRRTKTFSFG